MKIRDQAAFTLIELLIVVGVIALLATIVIVALNPTKRFADTRNSKRWQHVNSILSAVHLYTVDNNGSLPTGLTTSLSTKSLGTCVGCVDLSTVLAPYMKSMPLDPSNGTASNSGYQVAVDANNIVTISAPNAEQSQTIQVSR